MAFCLKAVESDGGGLSARAAAWADEQLGRAAGLLGEREQRQEDVGPSISWASAPPPSCSPQIEGAAHTLHLSIWSFIYMLEANEPSQTLDGQDVNDLN